jgi:hypothetical protein
MAISLRMSQKQLAKRRYEIDRDIHIVCEDDGSSHSSEGVLPAGTLIRNQRTEYDNPSSTISTRKGIFGFLTTDIKSRAYETFEASTDHGRTWYKCRTKDPFISSRPFERGLVLKDRKRR